MNPLLSEMGALVVGGTGCPHSTQKGVLLGIIRKILTLLLIMMSRSIDIFNSQYESPCYDLY